MYSSGTPSHETPRVVSIRGLRSKNNSELEEIVRENMHDTAVLNAVHEVLRGRSRKKAIKLRTEIRERLGLDRLTGVPLADMPIWTRAPLPPPKPWYRKWHYVLTMLGFVGVGAVYGVGFELWQMIHQGLLSLGERLQLF